MEKSESIKEISKALLEFQKTMDGISKDATNPFFKSKYATLTSIQDAIKEPLNSVGLVYTQMPDGDDCLTTILIHAESGEYFQSTNKMKPIKSDPQALGSAITYNRRYCLTSILGLNIEDDDGNKASYNTETKTAPTKKPFLNKMQGKEFTKEWASVQRGIISGDIQSLEDACMYFEMTKETGEEIKKLLK